MIYKQAKQAFIQLAKINVILGIRAVIRQNKNGNDNNNDTC